jgi:hypothetical protein
LLSFCAPCRGGDGTESDEESGIALFQAAAANEAKFFVGKVHDAMFTISLI